MSNKELINNIRRNLRKRQLSTLQSLWRKYGQGGLVEGDVDTGFNSDIIWGILDSGTAELDIIEWFEKHAPQYLKSPDARNKRDQKAIKSKVKEICKFADKLTLQERVAFAVNVLGRGAQSEHSEPDDQIVIYTGIGVDDEGVYNRIT